jgi:hypothetical protein
MSSDGDVLLGTLDGLMLGVPFLFSVTRFLACSARAYAAQRAVATIPELREDEEVTLTGRVDVDDGDIAIEIAIHQELHEWRGKGNELRRVWEERSRSIVVRPFHLVLANGERVRVEPDESVLLVNKLEMRQPADRKRTRSATLERGDAVSVSGVLRLRQGPSAEGAVYRTAVSEALVLAPPIYERMVASVEPLASRHRRRAMFHAVAVALATGPACYALLSHDRDVGSVLGNILPYACVFAILYPILALVTLPWYEHKRLSEAER